MLRIIVDSGSSIKIYEKEIFLEESITKKKISDYFIQALKNMFSPIGLTL